MEHAEVAEILSELPDEHPARMAYTSGAREASDSLSLTHLLSGPLELCASPGGGVHEQQREDLGAILWQ